MTEVRKTIEVLSGDGIGPEVTHSAVQLLTDCATAFNHKFTFRELPFGGTAIDSTGQPLPPETLEGCRSADAILLGAIGGPKWDSVPLDKRPESGLLGLRKGLGLYINLRPIPLPRALQGISPLRPERLLDVDIEIVRELAGDIYFGEHEFNAEKGSARDVAAYSHFVFAWKRCIDVFQHRRPQFQVVIAQQFIWIKRNQWSRRTRMPL